MLTMKSPNLPSVCRVPSKWTSSSRAHRDVCGSAALTAAMLRIKAFSASPSTAMHVASR